MLDNIEALKRMIERERKARKQAEAIIEQKALDLYNLNNDLRELNLSLEERILERTMELRKSKDQAEKNTEAKSLFLSNMSHEIRTPLNGILGITDIMLKETTENNIRELLKTVKYSADNLLEIINDILDFSKIEAGKITFEKIEFSFPELISNLKSVFKDRIDKKKLDLIVEIDKSVPEKLIGDRVKLNQVFTNLVGNAIKFTDKGFIKISIKAASAEKRKLVLQCEVQDSGIGISADKLEHVFESFSQSHASISRKFGGTGLGLAITKRLIELQKGKIFVESKEGKGSSFIFELPFKTSTSISKKKKQKEAILDPAELKGLKILVVEDNKINQFVIASVLKNWKIEVEIADHGKEAIGLLAEEDYDILLMDLHMPIMNGFETCKYIRSQNNKQINSRIPIIALSADAFEESKVKVLECGMDDFATKPIVKDELLGKLLHYRPKKQLNEK